MRNTIKINFVVLVLTVSLSIFSCSTQSSITEPASTLKNTPLPQNSSTALNLPTETVVPLTITPPPTISGISTLAPEKAYLVLQDILKNGCELPCWAGIVPGETLLIDASKTLALFRGISDWNYLSEKGGQIGITYPRGGIIISMFIDPESSRDSDYVQMLIIHTEALQEIEKGSYLRAYDAKPYHEIFGAYSLQNVFAAYGKPSEIYMTVEINEAEYNSPDFVLLWLLYPEKGFIAKYTANAEVIDDEVHGCPSKAFVELWLFPPYANGDYKDDLLPFDMTLGYILPTPSIRTKPIFEGLDMSLDEFYQGFQRPTNQCLETPLSIWPEWWR